MRKLVSSRFLRNESLIIVPLLLASAVLHGWNMFHFPYLENDEGVYMSQAWSLIKFGKLAPYTYWYDHAPGGWILIAIWTFLTGGFFTFGASVNSGRVLMLILHVLSTYFLYMLTKHFTKSKLAAVFACLLFMSSPLGIYFQRRVLLDNIMTTWILFSLYILTRSPLKIRNVVISSLAFGLAVLTKENAVFFAPGILSALWLSSGKISKKFALTYWIVISSMIISIYFVYALLKQELFTSGVLGNSSPHVSLLQTLSFQLNRGITVPFWNEKSEFMINFREWNQKDIVFIVGGILTSITTTLISVKNKQFRTIALLTLSFWAFLLRGKMVIVFYILPLLPFLAMSFGASLSKLLRIISFDKKYIYNLGSVIALLLISVYYIGGKHDFLSKDETSNQLRTLSWIKKNVPENSKLVIDSSIYVDLHDASRKGEQIFPYAEWVWKFEKDPAVFNNSFGSDWKNVEYITLSHEMLKQIRTTEFPYTRKALDNSIQIVDFTQNSTAYRNILQYISTNGDWMSVYKVLDKATIQLETSWQSYKKIYIHSYGQVINPKTNMTTSNLQADAMLQAAWVGDRETFDGLYSWTKDHLGYRGDYLFSSVWGRNGTKESVIDSEATTYADETIAFSLIIAANTWHDQSYLRDAEKIINDIWKKEVIKSQILDINTGTNAKNDNDLLVYQPAIFHTFSLVDSQHQWDKLAFDTSSIRNDLLIAQSFSEERMTSESILTTFISIELDHKLFHTQLPSAPESVGNYSSLKKMLLSTYNEATGIFDNPKDISLQHRAWVMTALQNNLLPKVFPH